MVGRGRGLEVFTPAAEAWLEVAALAHAPAATTARATRPRFPRPRHVDRMRLPGVLHGEMHAHTVHSDGRFTVAEQDGRAIAMGLDFVAMTDHNTTSGHADIDRGRPVVRLRGEELTTFHGHFCIYGIDRCHEWHDRGRAIRTVAAIDDVRAAGGLASLSHPNTPGAPVCVGCHFVPGSVPYDRFDLMEVWYGAWPLRHPEDVKTLDLWDRLWDQGMPKVAVAARDWHSQDHEDRDGVTFPVTAVLCGERTESAILAAIRAGRVFLTEGYGVEMTATSAAGEATIGGSVPLAGEASLAFRLHRTSTVPAIACLVRNGRLAASWSLPRRLDHAWSPPVTAPGRYRLEVWSEDGALLLLTNHVRVVG